MEISVVQVNFWTLNSTPLTHISIFYKLEQSGPNSINGRDFPISFEIKTCGFSNFVLLFQDSLEYFEQLAFLYDF